MVKLREARYCNLKLLLIFLVIYGHLIEPGIRSSGAWMEQYRGIYFVHMPLFAFLSGLFLSDCRGCGTQLKKILPLYALLQSVAVILGKGAVKPLTPYWHLWYLLSLSCWTALAWLWFRFGKGRGKFLILLLALAAGCCAGYSGSVGRWLSLSRTTVFFPYFWMGLICPKELPWRKLRTVGAVGLGICLLLIFTVSRKIPTTFLYQADPFGTIKSGIWLRLLCYLIGILLGLFLLTWIPERRFAFTKAGANTMAPYVFHAPFVKALRTWNCPAWVYALATALFLYLVFKLLQWHGAMYGIVGSERRERRWQHSKKCMSNTGNGCMASCCPSPEARI